ncbi:hypothetical protein PIROE2DRAFT_14086 [Piromyces sp. E2]|nr:hypothetical protein PIROE2DRAFT_14086 [Piromyces sp. E2]|eukprot:OUM60226.1 hypothetical protein PIROE2DRAFT_14086 [Piromyces sp. E2]
MNIYLKILLIFSLLNITLALENKDFKPEDNICNSLYHVFKTLPFKIEGESFNDCSIHDRNSYLSCKLSIFNHKIVQFELNKFMDSGNCNFDNCFVTLEKPYLTIFNKEKNKKDIVKEKEIIENIDNLEDLNKDKLFIFTVPYITESNYCTKSYIIRNAQFKYSKHFFFSYITKILNRSIKILIILLSLKVLRYFLNKIQKPKLDNTKKES